MLLICAEVRPAVILVNGFRPRVRSSSQPGVTRADFGHLFLTLSVCWPVVP